MLKSYPLKYLTTFLNDKNEQSSWRAFLRHVKTHKFVFGPRGFAHPLPGLCSGPTGSLGGPLDSRPNRSLVFQNDSVVSLCNENPVRIAQTCSPRANCFIDRDDQNNELTRNQKYDSLKI